MNKDLALVDSLIRVVPDFPIPGIMFRDITPVLSNPEGLYAAHLHLVNMVVSDFPVDIVVGIESRGFIFGAMLAVYCGAGFVPARKPGKLPADFITRNYGLEYGTNTLCMHKDSIMKGQRVLIVDDLLASGGTAKAAAEMVRELGGDIVACVFLIELNGLHGREKLESFGVKTLSALHYSA